MTMSVLAQYKLLMLEKERLEKQAAKMAETPLIQSMVDFERQLRELLAHHNVSLAQAVEIMDPSKVLFDRQYALTIGAIPKPNTGWRMRVYRNPHSEERVECRSPNHGKIREWRERWGKAVDNWWTYK